MLGGIHWRAALVGYSAGSAGEVLWDTQRDARRDSLAGCSGGLLGGIHWRAALVGYSARYTRRDPLASCSGGISTGQVWAWCRSIANADSNIKSNNPFLSGGNKRRKQPKKSINPRRSPQNHAAKKKHMEAKTTNPQKHPSFKTRSAFFALLRGAGWRPRRPRIPRAAPAPPPAARKATRPGPWGASPPPRERATEPGDSASFEGDQKDHVTM